MNFVLLFGPPAVGKMTVGQALAVRTGYKLMHNHVSLELANRFFDFGTQPFRNLDTLIRVNIFREVAKSDLPGFIFTFVWAQGLAEEDTYVDILLDIFRREGAKIHYVELEAEQTTRLARNRHPDRLAAKASKRALAFSEKLLLKEDATYRMNTLPGEKKERNILKINNDQLAPEAVAELIVEHFGW